MRRPLALALLVAVVAVIPALLVASPPAEPRAEFAVAAADAALGPEALRSTVARIVRGAVGVDSRRTGVQAAQRRIVVQVAGDSAGDTLPLARSITEKIDEVTASRRRGEASLAMIARARARTPSPERLRALREQERFIRAGLARNPTTVPLTVTRPTWKEFDGPVDAAVDALPGRRLSASGALLAGIAGLLLGLGLTSTWLLASRMSRPAAAGHDIDADVTASR